MSNIASLEQFILSASEDWLAALLRDSVPAVAQSLKQDFSNKQHFPARERDEINSARARAWCVWVVCTYT